MKRLAIFLILFFLSGCAFKELKPIDRYSIEPSNIVALNHSKYKNKILKVSYPISISIPLTDRIKYSYVNGDSGYYLNSKYCCNVAQLLNGYFIESLQKAAIFKSVVPFQSSVVEDLRLEIMVNKFYNRVDGENSYAVVDITFNLIDANRNSLIKTKRFKEVVKSNSLNAKGYIDALRVALNNIANNLIEWIAN